MSHNKPKAVIEDNLRLFYSDNNLQNHHMPNVDLSATANENSNFNIHSLNNKDEFSMIRDLDETERVHRDLNFDNMNLTTNHNEQDNYTENNGNFYFFSNTIFNFFPNRKRLLS